MLNHPNIVASQDIPITGPGASRFGSVRGGSCEPLEAKTVSSSCLPRGGRARLRSLRALKHVSVKSMN